jgi:hypothetical protein
MLVVLLLSGWLRSPEPASRQVREGGPPLKFYDARDNLPRELGRHRAVAQVVARAHNAAGHRNPPVATATFMGHRGIVVEASLVREAGGPELVPSGEPHPFGIARRLVASITVVRGGCIRRRQRSGRDSS